MWNIIKFLDIYYNEEPSQSITIDNNNDYWKNNTIILSIITIFLIVSATIYIILINKNKNGDK